MNNNLKLSYKSGILPDYLIKNLINEKQIISDVFIDDDQIQPASLDLRLGDIAYRVQASFLPGKNKSVNECLELFVLYKINLNKDVVLETNSIYIVPLLESINFIKNISGIANPKSSTGRIDVFTRIITDYSEEFNKIASGYFGKLYIEISPKTFPILVRFGSRLSQLRFCCGNKICNDTELKILNKKFNVVQLQKKNDLKINICNGIALRVDLKGKIIKKNNTKKIIGYKAKSYAGLIDIDKIAILSINKFWDPIYSTENNNLILYPGQFYILSSKEIINIPSNYAAEMIPYNTLFGEFRAHYAGFFDPGFGCKHTGGHGSKGVFEVRNYDVPFIIEDNQIIGRLVFEELIDKPLKLYGQLLTNNYQAQTLKLSKHFIDN